MTERYEKLPLMIVEPAYSPDDHVWFLDDGTTAKSLAALQAKLPHAVIEGYYPEGFTPERSKERSAQSEFRWSQMRAPQYKRRGPAPSISALEPVIEEEPEEIVTEAVFQEPRLVERAPEPEEPKQELVQEVTTLPKRPRKSRAALTTTLRRGSWSEEDDALLKTLASSGLTALQISLKMPGRTRNSIIGRCHRKGFPFMFKSGFEWHSEDGKKKRASAS